MDTDKDTRQKASTLVDDRIATKVIKKLRPVIDALNDYDTKG